MLKAPREKRSVIPEAGIEQGSSWEGQAPPGARDTVPKTMPPPSEAEELLLPLLPPPQPARSSGTRTTKNLTPES